MHDLHPTSKQASKYTWNTSWMGVGTNLSEDPPPRPFWPPATQPWTNTDTHTGQQFLFSFPFFVFVFVFIFVNTNTNATKPWTNTDTHTHSCSHFLFSTFPHFLLSKRITRFQTSFYLWKLWCYQSPHGATLRGKILRTSFVFRLPPSLHISFSYIQNRVKRYFTGGGSR